MSRRQIWTDPTAPEKKDSRHNPQHTGRSIRGFVPSFSLNSTNEAVSLSQASVDDEILGLSGSYHRHAIGTFNTCSRVPTPRSITDTHSLPFPSECSTGPPNWPCPVSILSNINHRFQGSSLKRPMSTTWSSDHSAIYRNLHLCLAIANGLSLTIGSTRVDWKVSLIQLRHQFNSYNLMHKQES
jgi:hypothetical protein